MAGKTTNWRDVEHEIAARLRLRRIAAAGRPGPDLVGPTLVVEVKARAHLPRWIIDALERARAAAGRWRLGIAVLVADKDEARSAIVVMALDDFLRLQEQLLRARAEHTTARGPENGKET